MPLSPQQLERFTSILPPARVLAIDNREEDLGWIRSGLEAAGIPCVPLIYDAFSGVIINKNMKTGHVRFVFMDLNLNEIDSNRAQDFVGPLQDALLKLNISGPYALIFWTTHPGVVEDTMRLLRQRMRSGLQLPFYFDSMDKNILRLPPNTDPTYSDRIECLKSEIEIKFTNKMIFSSIVSWENIVNESAAGTVNVFHKLISEPQADGTAQSNERYCKLLKTIGAAAWGGEHTKTNYGASVASGMNPFLSDSLDSAISINQGYRDIWHTALNNNINSTVSESIKYKLNTSCAIDESCKSGNVLGAWYEFKFNIDSKMYLTLFGKSGRKILSEFINYDAAGKHEKQNIRNKIKIGILDFTRPCDYANKKYGTKRFVLGAIIPNELKKHIKWENPSRDYSGDAIYKFPSLVIKNGGEQIKSVIQLSFKYVLSLPDSSQLLGDEKTNVKFRVRKQLLSEISVKYGAHTSNPGIMSF